MKKWGRTEKERREKELEKKRIEMKCVETHVGKQRDIMKENI